MIRSLITLYVVFLAVPPLSAAGLPTAPSTLAETGLYADPSQRILAPSVVEYQPRFPLWTDGLLKRRWILLPAGSAIDASDSAHWDFPVGTKVWKEFALPERPIETRFMERTATGWTFASYVWDVAATSATLAPVGGVRNAAELAPGVGHDVPGRYDCAICHNGQTVPVLGFGSVQLATGRVADGFPDLSDLSNQGLVTGAAPKLLELPGGPDPFARQSAALGYLHGNCGHCHNGEGPLASVGLNLRLEPEDVGGAPAALQTTLGRPATATARAASAAHRIEPGDPANSQVLQRLSTRDPLAQMPPLGTRLVDRNAVELLTAWIRADLGTTSASSLPQP